MKIKFKIPILSDREARYNDTSFLFRTNKQWMFDNLYRFETRFTHRHVLDYSKTNTNFKNEIKPQYNHDKTLHDYQNMDYFYEQNGDRLFRKYTGKSLNPNGELQVAIPRPNIGQSHKDDPLFENLKRRVIAYIMPKAKAKSEFDDILVKFDITFRYPDGDATITIRRKSSGFFIDGQKMVKDDVAAALAKIILRSVYVKSEEVMMDYVEKVTTIPHNVLHALENRTDYWFYDYGTRTDVKIDTRLISNTEVALELSEGVWAPMPIVELNRFIEFYRNGRKRGKKWPMISPENLWQELNGYSPTPAETKLMVAWLTQNRTEKMVIDRAEKLLVDLDREYPQITFMNWPNEDTNALHIRGKVCDWIVSANRGMKRGHQDVSTYRVGKKVADDSEGHITFANHLLSHSVCIDNLHNNSTTNDQLAARAMVLLNDKAAKNMIYTLSSLIDEAEQDDSWEYTARVSKRELRKQEAEIVS